MPIWHKYWMPLIRPCPELWVSSHFRMVEPMEDKSAPGRPGGKHQKGGAVLSILALLSWLSAVSCAVMNPFVGHLIPLEAIIGLVIASAAMSLLSVPKTLSQEKKSSVTGPTPHRA